MSRSGNEKAVGIVPELILKLAEESCNLVKLSREAMIESDILLPSPGSLEGSTKRHRGPARDLQPIICVSSKEVRCRVPSCFT